MSTIEIGASTSLVGVPMCALMHKYSYRNSWLYLNLVLDRYLFLPPSLVIPYCACSWHYAVLEIKPWTLHTKHTLLSIALHELALQPSEIL